MKTNNLIYNKLNFVKIYSQNKTNICLSVYDYAKVLSYRKLNSILRKQNCIVDLPKTT